MANKVFRAETIMGGALLNFGFQGQDPRQRFA
jgi:hypothetical protein